MKCTPIIPKAPFFLHGGDYSPEQWTDTPEILDDDMRLMKEAHCNCMTMGVFSWASIEPAEGVFTFDWLDRAMDALAKNGSFAVLATPSASRPAWLSAAYPEVARVNGDRVRSLHGGRGFNCYTSPLYRAKVAVINRTLAQRYKDHPTLVAWHVSNEYSGECHCELCQDAFRAWLRGRYSGNIDSLNNAWWSAFWSHTYTDWSQIQSPCPRGQRVLHGLNLDWKRFVTDQTIDFFRAEILPLKELTPGTPVTTNFMTNTTFLDLWKFAEAVDVVSWDSYCNYHDRNDNWKGAAAQSFLHDLTRCLKGGKPFMQMEATPSAANWSPINKLKRPNVHRTEMLQAVAHGADTVLYFQWRKNRGNAEKFHGAVVDHCGHEHTRVFRDVADVGRLLGKMDDVIGTVADAQVAIMYDWQNSWAIDDLNGPRTEHRDYLATCAAWYREFWARGMSVDVVGEDSDISKYRLVIAPMLYMVRAGLGERIEEFVKNGGTFVTTYLSGIADESDLCFLGGWPGPLRKVMGIWAEEIDALYDDESVWIVANPDNNAGLSGTYQARIFCDLIHAEDAEVLATYGSQFYAGRPAVTRNKFGRGEAYYVASQNDDRFHGDMFGHLATRLDLRRAVSSELPLGVTAQIRTDGEHEYLFLLNFTRKAATVNIGHQCTDMETGGTAGPVVELAPNGSAVLRRLSRTAA